MDCIKTFKKRKGTKQLVTAIYTKRTKQLLRLTDEDMTRLTTSVKAVGGWSGDSVPPQTERRKQQQQLEEEWALGGGRRIIGLI